MSKSSISLKGTLDPKGLALLFEDVAKSVKAGTVCLQKGSEFVTLKPKGHLEFEIEAAVKKGKQKLEISVKWEEFQELATPEEIKISAVEPELPPVESEVSGASPAGKGALADLDGGTLGMNEAKEVESKGGCKKK